MTDNWWIVKQMADSRMADLNKAIAGIYRAKIARQDEAARRAPGLLQRRRNGEPALNGKIQRAPEGSEVTDQRMTPRTA